MRWQIHRATVPWYFCPTLQGFRFSTLIAWTRPKQDLLQPARMKRQEHEHLMTTTFSLTMRNENHAAPPVPQPLFKTPHQQQAGCKVERPAVQAWRLWM